MQVGVERDNEKREKVGRKRGFVVWIDANKSAVHRGGDAIPNYKTSDINMAVCSWIEIYMIRGHMFDILTILCIEKSKLRSVTYNKAIVIWYCCYFTLGE